MSALQPYSYAVIRVVPRVDREEFINAGVVLWCRAHRHVDVRVHLDEARLLSLHPKAPLQDIRDQLDAFVRTARAGADAGPIAALPPSERFHWLTATRSTVVQCGPLHCGLTADPAATLDALLRRLVLAA